jgi:hypothetical protein
MAQWAIERGNTGSFYSTTALDATIGSRYVDLALATSGGSVATLNDRVSYHSINSFIQFKSDMVVVAEWEGQVRVGQVNGGFTNAQVFFGFASNASQPQQSGITAVGFLANAQGASSTNWMTRAEGGGAPADTDSGVARTLATWFKFRMELHGSATPLGAANGSVDTTRFFINDTLITTVQTLNSGALYWVMSSVSEDQVGNNNGDCYQRMGPVMIKWNRYANAVL